MNLLRYLCPKKLPVDFPSRFPLFARYVVFPRTENTQRFFCSVSVPFEQRLIVVERKIDCMKSKFAIFETKISRLEAADRSTHIDIILILTGIIYVAIAWVLYEVAKIAVKLDYNGKAIDYLEKRMNTEFKYLDTQIKEVGNEVWKLTRRLEAKGII